MSDIAEGKAWVAAASEAMEYFLNHGPEEAMSSEKQRRWNQLVEAAQEAADRHDTTRGFE